MEPTVASHLSIPELADIFRTILTPDYVPTDRILHPQGTPVPTYSASGQFLGTQNTWEFPVPTFFQMSSEWPFRISVFVEA